jgi:hypothetical protein
MTNIFAEDNAEDLYGNGALGFVSFAERFRDNPEVYNTIQGAISFDWTQDDVDAISNNQTPEQIQESFVGASNPEWVNGGQSLLLIQAANETGGPEQVAAMMESSNANPVQLVESMAGDPLRQQHMYEILVMAGYADELAAAQLNFDNS